MPMMLRAMAEGKCEGVIERETHIDYLSHGNFNAGICTKYATRWDGSALQFQKTDFLTEGPMRYAVGFWPGHRNGTGRDGKSPVALDRDRLSYWMTQAVAAGEVNELYTARVMTKGCFDTENMLNSMAKRQFTVQNMSRSARGPPCGSS